jgi:hypothetical protein
MGRGNVMHRMLTQPKKSRKAITLEIKHEILSQHESGMKVNELASKFKLWYSTVSTILKHKGKYLKEVKSARPMQSKVIRKSDRLIPEVEKLLIAWTPDTTNSYASEPSNHFGEGIVAV